MMTLTERVERARAKADDTRRLLDGRGIGGRDIGAEIIIGLKGRDHFEAKLQRQDAYTVKLERQLAKTDKTRADRRARLGLA